MGGDLYEHLPTGVQNKLIVGVAHDQILGYMPENKFFDSLESLANRIINGNLKTMFMSLLVTNNRGYGFSGTKPNDFNLLSLDQPAISAMQSSNDQMGALSRMVESRGLGDINPDSKAAGTYQFLPSTLSGKDGYVQFLLNALGNSRDPRAKEALSSINGYLQKHSLSGLNFNKGNTPEFWGYLSTNFPDLVRSTSFEYARNKYFIPIAEKYDSLFGTQQPFSTLGFGVKELMREMAIRFGVGGAGEMLKNLNMAKFKQDPIGALSDAVMGSGKLTPQEISSGWWANKVVQGARSLNEHPEYATTYSTPYGNSEITTSVAAISVSAAEINNNIRFIANVLRNMKDVASRNTTNQYGAPTNTFDLLDKALDQTQVP
jgi:hypothetical protein